MDKQALEEITQRLKSQWEHLDSIVRKAREQDDGQDWITVASYARGLVDQAARALESIVEA